MKKTFKNKEKRLKLTTLAFTLIELLAVVVILGIIALITYPIINNSIEQSKQGALEKTIKSIEEAAYKYSIKNDLGYSSTYQILEFETLINEGFLKKDIINPITNQKLEGCILYKWDENNNQYIFKYDEECEISYNFINTLLGQYKEGNTTGLVRDMNNLNLYYYTGNDEQVTNNYLWYGGHQWRVLEFDTNANTLVLVTQQPLTSISPANTVWTTKETYESSYINDWLNNYFWNSLNDNIKNNIIYSIFNIGIYDNVDEITTTQKVGLLDLEQYVRAGSNGSYLDIKDYFWLGNRYSSSNIRYVFDDGVPNDGSVSNPSGVRAVIKISDLTITGGDGTLTNSYHVDIQTSNSTDIQVGEYINISYNGDDNKCGSDNICTFRVISKSNDNIKLILNGLISNTSEWANNAVDNITTDDTIYVSLKSFIENLDSTYTTTGKFGVGMYEIGNSYTVPQLTSITTTVGLPTVGEMFSGNDIDISYPTTGTKKFVDINTIENPTISSYYWTMNRSSSSLVRFVSSGGTLNSASVSSVYGIRPVIYIRSGITFSGGNGTAQAPYILK